MMNIARLLIFFAGVTAGLAYAGTYSKEHEKVQTLFESDQEPAAQKALWTARDMLNIGVVDDGSKQDAYAQHVCEVLYDHGFKGKKIWVMVFDVGAYSELGKMKDIGGAQCR